MHKSYPLQQYIKQVLVPPNDDIQTTEVVSQTIWAFDLTRVVRLNFEKKIQVEICVLLMIFNHHLQE